MTDWLPTLLSAAGINLNLTDKIDGIDQWSSLSGAKFSEPRRHEIPVNIDEKFGYGTLISGGYKLVNRTTFNGTFDKWMGNLNPAEVDAGADYFESVFNSVAYQTLSQLQLKSENDTIPETQLITQLRNMAKISCLNSQESKLCNPLVAPCLFNLIEDPCEEYNLAEEEPERLRVLIQRLSELSNQVVPARNVRGDVAADPIQFNNTWTWWSDESRFGTA